jgi:hypothetical protein
MFYPTDMAEYAGGAQNLVQGNPYYDAMSMLTDMAMHEHDRSGESFPIHYTCLGWEAIAVKVSNDPFIQSAILMRSSAWLSLRNTLMNRRLSSRGFLLISMGLVVGEKNTRSIEYANQNGLVLIMVCASSGARMQGSSGEPRAVIGFAGRRVIEQMLGDMLPEFFHKAVL